MDREKDITLKMDHVAFRTLVYLVKQRGFPDLMLPGEKQIIQNLCESVWQATLTKMLKKAMFPTGTNASIRLTYAEASALALVLSTQLNHADPYNQNTAHRTHLELIRQIL